ALCFGDGPAGVGNGMTGVTQFPAPVAGAATWNAALLRRYGMALADEHAGKGRNVVLAPTINILRTPRWGRAAESLGEDPYLTGQLGAAVVDGIQSRGVIATPKHFVANNQETLRLGDAPSFAAIDVLVSERALREIYLPAFRATVELAHAGSVMCSYNRINGVYACESPLLDQILRRDWHFDGFVVSDWYFAHRSTVAAALAGLDVSMPGGSNFGFPAFFGEPLRKALDARQVSPQRLDTMAENILRPVFRLGLADKRASDSPAKSVRSAEHSALALAIAQQGSVLLKNRGELLPLRGQMHSIAVIGDDAGERVQTTERYGGFVNDPNIRITAPREAITRRAGDAVSVTYEPGTLGTGPLPAVPASVLSSAHDGLPGLSASWYGSVDPEGSPLRQTREAAVDLHEAPPGLPAVWSARWQGRLTPPRSGRYRFSLSGGGDAVLYIDGREVTRIYKQGFTSVSHGVITLSADRPVPVRIDYAMAPTISKPRLQWGWQPPDDRLAKAVAAARRADVAIVFASDNVSEGGDRTSLRLPGDQDELIAAVAAANPHAVVVLHTVGPVLMPWLSKVAAVIEAWYPGEAAADAIAAVLFGDVNPSGKLPMTFPATDHQGPDTTPDRFPGTKGRVSYDEELDVGYRYFDARHETPLFPFGFGLAYSRFRIDQVQIHPARSAVRIDGRVSNVGSRSGTAVVQLYLGFPASAGEPPWQLRGFDRIELAGGESQRFSFELDRQSRSIWDSTQRAWVIPPGEFRVALGSSVRDIEQRDSLP
ncbi:MAG: glycoside hydrolase family 3 C-terminal domain-containing protein, partial [Sinobacteraceae bacterium]|nr:glycoside hydrolase family 3 C-terminal domain-containing protein [Nevskiaceae bacterium]